MPSYLVSAKESFVPTQMYTPPIQTIGEMLRIKQGQYDQGYNQLNAGRNAIQDAEVLSQDGTAKKQQYLNQADNTLKQLSQADLSLPENQQLADQVFKPFWEDKDLVSEISKIRNINKELSFGEQARTSTDKDLRESYNPFSIQDLQNQKQEIAESNAEERKTMQPRSYVKAVDVTKEMDAALEKIGGQKGSLREDVNGGGYKFINQFGKEAVLPLNDFFMSSLSPNARAYMQVMGRLEGRNIYNRAYAITGGDRDAAKTMVAENIMQQKASAINDELIPELNRSAANIQGNIKAMLLAAQQSNSDLSPQQEEYIKQQTDLYTQQKKKIDGLTSEYKELTDKNAPDYQKNVGVYKAGADDFYTQSAIGKYANGWARSRAAVLSSQKVEEDKTNIALQQINQNAIKENDHVEEFKQSLKLKEELGLLKANATAKKAAGQVGGGSSQGVYIGQNPNGNQLVNKYENYATVATQLKNLTVDPTISLVQKTMNDNLQLPNTLYTRLLDGMHTGKDGAAFFTNDHANSNDPEYAAFKKAFTSGQLATTPGQAYKWTYQQVFDTLQNSFMNWRNTDEGKLKVGNNGIMEVDQLDKCADAYKASKEDQAILHKQVLSNPKYAGFTTTKDGLERLMTDQEMIGETTIPMPLANNPSKVVPVKINDIINNLPSIKETRYGHEGININGQTYEYGIGGFKTSKALELLRRKGWEGAQSLKSDELKKLSNLRSQFLEDFNNVAPSLKTATTLKNDALNYGIQQYSATDKKDTGEAAEVAVKSLLGPENIRAAHSQLLGVSNDDLKPDSAFMKLLNGVNSFIAPGNEDVVVNASAYDTEAGGKAFKIILKPEDLYKALGTTPEKATADEKKAVETFRSDNFRIKPPQNVQDPGGIITGTSPTENMVRRGGYETSKYMDDLKMGGFKLEKQAVGGFALKMWAYVPNPKTGQLEKTNYDDATIPQTFPDTVDVNNLMNVCYTTLQNQFNKNKSYIRANPAVPKGSGTSVQSMIDALKQKGININ